MREAAKAALQARALTVGEVWPLYLEQGRPKRKDDWPRYRADLEHGLARWPARKQKGARANPARRAVSPLWRWSWVALLRTRSKFGTTGRPWLANTKAARALMMFRGFLRWCGTRPEYRNLIDREAAKAPAIVESLPSTQRRTDLPRGRPSARLVARGRAASNRTASAHHLRALLYWCPP